MKTKSLKPGRHYEGLIVTSIFVKNLSSYHLNLPQLSPKSLSEVFAELSISSETNRRCQEVENENYFNNQIIDLVSTTCQLLFLGFYISCCYLGTSVQWIRTRRRR